MIASAADANAVPVANAGLTTPAFDASAKYRAVHVDTLDPRLQHVFEDARVQWLKVLADHHTTDGRGFFLQRDGNTLLTLRSFDSFTEYDALRAFRAAVGDRIGPSGEKAGQLYDLGDVAITSPHNTEVWSRSEESDYRAPGPALDEYTAGYMQMVVEQVRSDDYDAAWKEIRAALDQAKYPLSRIGFFSMIGSGRHISLWLAADRAAFRSAGTPEEAVAGVLGADKASALFKRLSVASSDRQVSELVPRPELKSPE
ncbi:MAG TPA: hypothetical protein VK753_05850 [Xanthomonadaceae bacterium]|jgi:hypothetical protein|nr:hypothetical protein [Xanthomonadaceae bacterium]